MLAANFAGRFAAENAASIVIVVKFGAGDALPTFGAYVDFGSGEHADQRGSKINPQSVPVVGRHRRSETTRRVHAHARQRSFEGYISRYQCARAKACEFVPASIVGDMKNDG